MKDITHIAFGHLFRQAFKKCFGYDLLVPMTETESRHFSNIILDQTGLVIGPKSLKNYSSWVLETELVKQENPSVATMDTLSRYVLEIPYTNELSRKERESHYPYWFQYRNAISAETGQGPAHTQPAPMPVGSKSTGWKWLVFILSLLVLGGLFLMLRALPGNIEENFTEDFHTVREDSLHKNGWILQSRVESFWKRRDELPAHLTLFTLKGDNWTDSAPIIRNLLVREVRNNCFTAEVHLDDFFPNRRWQQAGIILLEDTNFSGRSLRLSIAYNDFFGGYARPKEIIIQAISSAGNELKNPEEILHLPAFVVGPGQDSIVESNLKRAALKIEKSGNQLRLLYSLSQVDNFAFKEALSKEINIHPKFIGIFALMGFVQDSNYIPAHFKFFSISKSPCNN